MKPTREIPHDPALPGLEAIRAHGLEAVLPGLGLSGPVDLLLRGYTPGKRATLEARSGSRHVAVKCCAGSGAAGPEVRLYEELAARGLAAPVGASAGQAVRVPALLAWNDSLSVMATGWLDGPSLNELVKAGRGQRAGELAACWFRRVASLSWTDGESYGPEHLLRKAPGWAATLAARDAVLGSQACDVARALGGTAPPAVIPHLVHGTLYARHIVDLGDGPGLIDWDAFGHGPLEFDAGTWLATVYRIQLSNPGTSGSVARAERAFRAGTIGVLDGCALSWYRAAALLTVAHRLEIRAKGNWKARALALLTEAARLVVTAAA